MPALLSAATLLEPELETLAESLRRVTVRVHASGRHGDGMGSGVVWSRHGVVITNAHVARTSGVAVQLWDGRWLDARLIARDPRRDLAAVRVDATDLEHATVGDARALRTGELVVAVGNPFGVAGALSVGVVHASSRVAPFVKSDVRLAPGNSGGPLATPSGHVVGINAMIVNGMGVAIASHAVEEFIREAVWGTASGTGRRPRVA